MPCWRTSRTSSRPALGAARPLELLADRLASTEDDATHELVHALERGTLRLTHLVDNLLESARIEAGSHSIRRRQVALDEVVEEAVEWTSPLLAQRNSGSKSTCPFPCHRSKATRARLVQVLVNLLANANKFAPADSAIRIAGCGGRRRGHLWVEDQGPGLPEIAGRSLFGRFVRSADDHEP
jgi:K+-sensing histidine kinase KdpD